MFYLRTICAFKNTSPDYPRQKGNALFLILIAVALFAALAYAVTQSGKGSGTVSKEDGVLEAAQMIQYAGDIKTAITRLRLVNNCTDTTISLAGLPPGASVNASAPADKSCHVFDKAGGGVSVVRFKAADFTAPTTSAAWTTNMSGYPIGYSSFNGYNQITGAGTSAVAPATTGVDLIFQMFPLRQDICVEINRRLNVNAPSFAAPSGTIYFVNSFNGTYTNGSTMAVFDNSKVGGCYYETNYKMYVYVQPVIER